MTERKTKQNINCHNCAQKFEENCRKKEKKIRRIIYEQVGNTYKDLEIMQKESSRNF